MLEGDDGTRRGDRVTEVYAWLAIDPRDNCEGIVAGTMDDTWVPLIGADRERIESYRSIAERAGRLSSQTIKLVRFTQREELKVLDG